MESKFLFISLAIFFFLSISTAALSTTESVTQQQQGSKCIYTVFVKTGTLPFAGTDAKISLKVFNDAGETVDLGDLEAWGGAMGKGWNYYENGNLDVFTGTAPCLSRVLCAMEIASDSGGWFHAWNLEYVTVSITAPGQTNCFQVKFTVNSWLVWPLATSDREDYCPKKQLPIQTLMALGLTSS